MSPRWKIDAPRKVKLDDYDPNDTGTLSREDADAKLGDLSQRLSALQALLDGAGREAVLIVLQGLDTAGKDGTIKHVMSQVNPIGCRVASFRAPTDDELRHDFLWRVHQQTPAHGTMTIFNRSHYEDVLVVRVEQLVPPNEWKARFAEINDFERLLTRSGTMVLKFFLHISKDEQRKRLLAREDDPTKAWKLSVEDWKDHARWDDYRAAYEEALGRCATAEAPWYIVPANHKWYRNFVVARTIVERLAEREPAWKDELEARGKLALAALREAHVHDDEPGA